MTPQERSKIEELKKSLYSRNAPDIKMKRRVRFSQPTEAEVPTDWEHPEETPQEETVLNTQYKNSGHNFFTKLFIGSMIFFVCALTFGAFLIWRGENTISANNIDITVNGPITIPGGEELVFDVQVRNKNNVELQTVDFVVDYPSGTVDAVDRSKELRQFRELMDNISPGRTGEKRLKAVLYGEENGKKPITISVTYRVPGSNAVFEKKKIYDVLISSSPLSLTVSGFGEVTTGQEFETEVVLASNSSDVIKNLLLRVQYPFGFTLTTSDAKAEGNTSTWKVGDIPPKGKKTIRFKGRLEGQDGEVRVFRFTAGAQSLKTPGTIGTEYIASTKEVSIEKPFISVAIALDNDSGGGEYNGSFNTPVKATISWFNNLATAVIDGELRVKLSGTAFDKSSVSPGEGHYLSADNVIVWNKQTTPQLANIGAGESGSINFTLTPRNFSTAARPVTSPNLSLVVDVAGKRLSENSVPENVLSSARRTVKISSNLTLASQIVRSTGAFQNTGPVPPKAEQQTTYTVVWTVDNTVNTVSGAEVRALLPVHAKWLGKISPTGEELIYNSNTGQLLWRVGNVNTFTANSGQRRQVSFQIGFTPSVSQVGQVPILVQDTTLTGIDDYTMENLSSTQPALTTRFSTDPAFRDGNDLVVR